MTEPDPDELLERMIESAEPVGLAALAPSESEWDTLEESAARAALEDPEWAWRQATHRAEPDEHEPGY